MHRIMTKNKMGFIFNHYVLWRKEIAVQQKDNWNTRQEIFTSTQKIPQKKEKKEENWRMPSKKSHLSWQVKILQVELSQHLGN